MVGPAGSASNCADDAFSAIGLARMDGSQPSIVSPLARVGHVGHPL